MSQITARWAHTNSLSSASPTELHLLTTAARDGPSPRQTAYVWGNYNQTNASYLATTNTSGGTVPAAFISDSLTVLSSQWNDRLSLTNGYTESGGTASSWNAASSDTINAAIVTGVVPSTGTAVGQFSGGVHNLTRLLENWSSSTLWLNTSHH